MRIPLRRRFHALLVCVASAAALTGSAQAAAPTVASVTPWKTNALPAAWVGGRIYYSSKGTNGLYNAWSANPDGSGAVCLTCIAAFPATTQHSVADVSPDGRYALVTIERSGHWPLPDGTGSAEPGRGAYNDLYLETTDGKQAWKLVDLLQQGTNALIWARFDASGTHVVWSEQWSLFSSSIFGAWRLHVGTLSWANGTPSLTNVKTLQSSGFMEPYGFTADGSKVLFTADALAGSDWSNLQIMQESSDLSGTPTKLTPQDALFSGMWANYNEFPAVMPGTGRIIFARSVGAWYGSLDYWTINPDGTDAKQLTHIGGPGQSTGQLAVSYAFDSTNPKHFIAGVQQGYGGPFNAVLVTLN
jgi:hypothetical protein